MAQKLLKTLGWGRPRGKNKLLAAKRVPLSGAVHGWEDLRATSFEDVSAVYVPCSYGSVVSERLRRLKWISQRALAWDHCLLTTP
nr:unnamed protein product [Spirometra erinaceieuropaei]